MPGRGEAVELLEEWVDNENLRKHIYAVEAAVRSYAPGRTAPTRTCGGWPGCSTT